MASVAFKSSRSPLLNVPGEIRNRIYDFLFNEITDPYDFENLPRTCKLLYAETQALTQEWSRKIYDDERTLCVMPSYNY